MGFLSDKNSQVRHSLAEHPLDVGRLEARAQERPPARAWVDALSAVEMSLIAEVKRSSPSAGHIADTDPAQRARTYEAAGAAAISVLTEERHFGGSLADLEAVHGVTSVPILRKDFLVDALQLLEARAEGADAALLIAASLSADQLDEMLGAAGELRLGILLEIHSLEDLDKALSTDAVVIGV
ncbi:MAG: indole-3-glycerol phosphate synthase TrpC, partial [Actinobacteria bacterium]|nr:indole-3-glycerol phosphate synthase TrpC [Actinomycetota bacterium]